MLPFTNAEISSIQTQNEYWQRVFNNFLEEISNKYPQIKKLQFIKRTNWIIPYIVWETPIFGGSNSLPKQINQERQLISQEI